MYRLWLKNGNDGNNMDNFALLWDIGKIFGMLEDLSAPNKATRHFFIYAKMSQVCMFTMSFMPRMVQTCKF